MRKAIAAHMVASRRTAAHCSTVIEADFSAGAAARRELKEPMARRGVPLTYLAFVARATVEALGEFPSPQRFESRTTRSSSTTTSTSGSRSRSTTGSSCR